MKYMLITPKCKVYIFRVYNLALTYQMAYGGTLSTVYQPDNVELESIL